jgi:serine/threonine protein kinase
MHRLFSEHSPGADLERWIAAGWIYAACSAPGDASEAEDGSRRVLNRLLSVAERVAEGLAVLHRHGVNHLDVKPHNVLIDAAGIDAARQRAARQRAGPHAACAGDASDAGAWRAPGTVRLTDFGLAATDQMAETPGWTAPRYPSAYASPEQHASYRPVSGGASDVFSFALLLLHMWGGEVFWTAAGVGGSRGAPSASPAGARGSNAPAAGPDLRASSPGDRALSQGEQTDRSAWWDEAALRRALAELPRQRRRRAAELNRLEARPGHASKRSPPTFLLPPMPGPVAALTRAALSRDPARRPSARAMQRALRAAALALEARSETASDPSDIPNSAAARGRGEDPCRRGPGATARARRRAEALILQAASILAEEDEIDAEPDGSGARYRFEDLQRAYSQVRSALDVADDHRRCFGPSSGPEGGGIGANPNRARTDDALAASRLRAVALTVLSRVHGALARLGSEKEPNPGFFEKAAQEAQKRATEELARLAAGEARDCAIGASTCAADASK